MDKNLFYGAVSITARLSFNIEAESKEEAIEKIFNSSCDIQLNDENGVKIEIIDQEWDMINEENVGNVGERNIRDFEIYKEK